MFEAINAKAWKHLAALGLAGAVLGAGLPGGGSTGADRGVEGRIETTRSSAAVTHCPGGPAAGELHAGDRVYVVGRSDDGTWVELRAAGVADGTGHAGDPGDPGPGVWLPSDRVAPDGTFDDLPVRGCRMAEPVDDEAAAPGSVESSASTTSTTTTTPHDVVSSTRAPREAGDQGSGARDEGARGEGDRSEEPRERGAPQRAAKPEGREEPEDSEGSDDREQPEDREAPEIGAPAADPAAIWEDGPVCDGRPRTSTVSVEVSDERELAAVELSWSVAGEHGTIAMTGSGSSWSAVVGPFDEDTIPYATSESVGLRVEATDTAGNRSVAEAEDRILELHDCTFG